MSKQFLGLDIGGTNLKTALFSAEGMVLAEDTRPTLDDGTAGWLERARAAVHEVLKRGGSETRIGVAAPGMAARDRRFICNMPGRLPGLENLDWQQWLGMKEPVPVYNDAHAALLGEAWIGAARGAQNVVLLTLGTGVGGAILVEGCILHGHLGRAGHLGHLSLNPKGAPDIVNTPGSLEDALGEHTVSARSGGRFTSTRQLVEAYRAGSKEAAEVWLNSIQALGAAIAGIINVLDPELILLGGGIADANEALFGPLQAALDKFEWRPNGARVHLAKAALGNRAGAAGAARAAQLATE